MKPLPKHKFVGRLPSLRPQMAAPPVGHRQEKAAPAPPTEVPHIVLPHERGETPRAATSDVATRMSVLEMNVEALSTEPRPPSTPQVTPDGMLAPRPLAVSTGNAEQVANAKAFAARQARSADGLFGAPTTEGKRESRVDDLLFHLDRDRTRPAPIGDPPQLLDLDRNWGTRWDTRPATDRPPLVATFNLDAVEPDEPPAK